MLGTLPFPDKTQVEYEEVDGRIRSVTPYINVGQRIGTYMRYLSETGKVIDFFAATPYKFTFPDPPGTLAVIIKVNIDNIHEVPIGNAGLFPSSYEVYRGVQTIPSPPVTPPEVPAPDPWPGISGVKYNDGDLVDIETMKSLYRTFYGLSNHEALIRHLSGGGRLDVFIPHQTTIYLMTFAVILQQNGWDYGSGRPLFAAVAAKINNRGGRNTEEGGGYIDYTQSPEYIAYQEALAKTADPLTWLASGMPNYNPETNMLEYPLDTITSGLNDILTKYGPYIAIGVIALLFLRKS